MSVFRIIGCALIFLAILLIRREYSIYVSCKTSELCGFSLLLSHMESEISKYLSYGREMWHRLACDGLERSGFLQLLKNGHAPDEALALCKNRLLISKETQQSLSDFFKSFCSEYKDGALKKISEYRIDFDKKLEEEKKELQKSLKITSTLLLGGGLTLLILVI